ncbi:Unknown protein [Striga hermonthica]|uniref:FBD domain-containing protein n=1 Tax=Striga hermonthica TaxID=68872 RepID=A0A9N7MMX3_STRHE|nr:Unknown protein [Striga hermonthica]
MASIDRLSSLPDDVICHILSFLPTKLSVATSVLRKSWRFLWAHVPCLNFSGYDFRKADFSEEEETQASNIIHRVILQHKAKRISTLTLDCINCNEYKLETLVTTAIDRCIQNLYLKLNFDTFPRSLFNCKTIVDLELDNNRAPLSAVGNVSLPSLKKFYVYNVVCENDDTLPRFLSGCPSLEELNMVFGFVVEDDYVGCINISSLTIKKLKLHLKDVFCPCNLEYRMIINAPAIKYLQVNGYDLERMTIPITMISLVEANIHLKNDSCINFKTNYYSTDVKFLHSLCYVKCLKISGWDLDEFIQRGVAGLSLKFRNLTKLELGLYVERTLLVKFLEAAENLEVLIVYLRMESLWTEPKQVPICMLSRLKTIIVKWIKFSEPDLDMIRYLLRNSRVLERMEIFDLTFMCIDRERIRREFHCLSEANACQLAFYFAK